MTGPYGPITFLTMKLLRGETLLERLKRAGRFDPDTLVPVAKQMADALDAAHRVGVVHRDFKPGNVMLESSGQQTPRVSITDFGLSRAQESDATLAETGVILGTPGYIAPELIQGRIASFTADVYAFGVVLHEMATGKKPVHENGTFARPTTLAPDLPEVWDRIILGCLEPDTSKRFQSAGEAMALLDLPKSKPVSAPEPARVTTRATVWAAAAVVVVIAALVGWLALGRRLDSLLHPLPQKRFVALMAWPADPNSANRPLLKNVLDTVGSRLARAEATTKDLLIISQADVAGPLISAPVDAIGALGANLVLAASTREAGDGVALDLALIDAATSKELRKTELRTPVSDLSRLPDRAAVSAAKLLDVQLTSTQWKDQDELASIMCKQQPTDLSIHVVP
jgi:serine/threonine-protein kinase